MLDIGTAVNMTALGEEKEPIEQDERILKAIRDDFHETVLHTTDLKSLLPILVKFGYISEERHEKLKTKTQSDAAATFQAMLRKKKSQALRRGFLLALMESATSVRDHRTLLNTLIEAAKVDMKSLMEEERDARAVATGKSA